MYFYVFLGVFRHVAQKQISQQKSLETLTHQGFQGFSVGALSTLIYVWYEQFMRDKKSVSAAEGVIATLIEGYVPSESVQEISAKIALAIEKDVTGSGAKNTAEILSAAANGEEISENDITLLSRLIIETLAHISTD